MTHGGFGCITLIAVFALCGFLYADEAGKIMRPTNNAAIYGMADELKSGFSADPVRRLGLSRSTNIHRFP